MALSRRQIAKYVAKALHDGVAVKQITKELAAYLYESKKTKEAELLLRDIESVLSETYGTTLATVTSAHPLDDTKRDDLKAFIKEHEGAKEVTLSEEVDSSVIGGVVVETTNSLFDASIRHQLQQLKALSKS